MTEMLQYIQVADQTFWGTDVYHVWFYIAVLMIIILEKSPIVKRVIGIYPICVILALYCPITYWLIHTYTSGKWQYFARLYSMIPLPITIGLGTVLLTEVLCSIAAKAIHNRKNLQDEQNNRTNAILKVFMAGCFCGLIVFGGTNVYKQDWMQPAQNYNKVPEDAKAICRAVHQNGDVTIAVPDQLAVYIRQIDADIYMPYGRTLSPLGFELSKENPDPEYVMMEAGEKACDYVVVYNNMENESQFQLKGWSPFLIQGRYLIYKVANINRTKNTYNNNRQLIEQKYYDSDGKPIQNKNGYYGIKYEYDQNENRTKETFLTYNYAVAILNGGYSSIKYTYDYPVKRIVSKQYLDNKDNPVCINGRYETGYNYDQKGYLIRESFYDENGELMDHSMKHYAVHEIVRDEKGRIQAELYYNKNGLPTGTSMGYSAYEIAKNEEDAIVWVNYYDEQNKLLNRVEGATKKERELFLYHHSSEGALENGAGNITYTTSVPNNHFNMVCFQLYKADGSEYLLSFGDSCSVGKVTGEYYHQLPEGIYRLRLKANTNLSDEYVDSYVFLETGDKINYRYIIDEFGTDQIILRDISVQTEQ